MPRPSAALTAWIALVAALALYAFLAERMSSSFMVISEESVNAPIQPPGVFFTDPDANGAARLMPTCGDPGVGHTVVLPSRPRWLLCLGTRALPIMIAPYFTGIFGWPFALLSSLHHGDVLLLRKFGLVVGLASLLLTFAFARRLSGALAAACVTIALAATPVFVTLNSDFFLFESLPWLLAMAGTVVLLRREPTSVPLTTPRVVAGAFLLGLSLLANARGLFILVPLALVAWRLRAPLGGIRLGQWILAALMVLIAIAPMLILRHISPEWVMGDRSTRAGSAFAMNWQHPRVFVEAAEELITWWSNQAYLLRFMIGSTPFNVPAAVVASLAAVFVTVDGMRTLWRREGDRLTAVCAALFLFHMAAVGLLYSDDVKNYSTLVPVFGLALGTTAYRLGRLLPGAIWPVLVAVVLSAPIAGNTLQTIKAMNDSQYFLALSAEKEAAAWLRAHPLPGAQFVTWQSFFTGIFDSLTEGEVHTIDGHPLVASSENAPSQRDALVSRLTSLRLWSHGAQIRTIVPVDIGKYRWGHTSPGADMDSVHLADLAQAAGFDAKLQATFHAADGVPALAVWDLKARP